MSSSSVAFRTKQSPRAAAVACRKNLKATAEDCYDFSEVEAESWRSFQPAVVATVKPSATIKIEVSAASPTRESRHSRHSRHVISY
jgi:hypothetical protein